MVGHWTKPPTHAAEKRTSAWRHLTWRRPHAIYLRASHLVGGEGGCEENGVSMHADSHVNLAAPSLRTPLRRKIGAQKASTSAAQSFVFEGVNSGESRCWSAIALPGLELWFALYAENQSSE